MVPNLERLHEQAVQDVDGVDQLLVEGGQGLVLAGDFSRPEEAEGLAGGLDAPGAGYIGLAGRGRLVVLTEELQDLTPWPLLPCGPRPSSPNERGENTGGR